MLMRDEPSFGEAAHLEKSRVDQVWKTFDENPKAYEPSDSASTSLISQSGPADHEVGTACGHDRQCAVVNDRR
jgi:hypothetical protein